MSEPNFRMLVRSLRLREDAKKAGRCHECGRKFPKPKRATAEPTAKCKLGGGIESFLAEPK